MPSATQKLLKGVTNKRQQSLAGFFKPKSTEKNEFSTNGTSKAPQHPSPSSPRDEAEPARKRARLSHDREATQENVPPFNDLYDATPEDPADNDSAARKVSLPNAEASSPVKNVTVSVERKKPRISERTSQYLYSNSQLLQVSAQEADEAETTRRASLHDRFVRKLGRPDSLADIKKRGRVIDDDTEALEPGDEDAEEEDLPPPPKKKGAATKKATLTPMEKQIIELKAQNPDTLLVVEVGYKYRFFGDDARVAAKELGIVCIPGKFRFDNDKSEAHLDRFASASFPTHRLHVHVRRLVAAGHKVGVVRQLETAALKAIGDNRNTPFVRKLTNLYTKGTYIDDTTGLGLEEEASPEPDVPASDYLLCITESNAKGWGNDEKVHVGIVAVQPRTGDIIYDDFEDDFMRTEIETRLLHIAPVEFLIIGNLSKATEKLVQHLSGTKSNVFGDRARVERIDKPKNMVALAHSHLTKFYAGKLGSSDGDDKGSEASKFEQILRLPEHVMVGLSAMIEHLSRFNLEHVFDLGKPFQSFSLRSHMLLNGTTLSSLEIYQNQTDFMVKGSLFWALNRTKTRFGQRLFRKWVGRPLVDKSQLEERVAAVEELKDSSGNIRVQGVRSLLVSTHVDLEKSLMRICYGRCTRSELLNSLQTLQKIAGHFESVGTPADVGFQSRILNEAVAVLPVVLDDVVSYLDKIDPEAAKNNDKYAFFREQEATEEITNHQLQLVTIEQDLDDHRAAAATKIGKKKVEYVTVAGIDYLIEVDNSELKKVPASWIKISGTKKLSRFHTPEVLKLIRSRDQHKELLAAACDTAYANLLADITNRSQAFRDCIQALATLDCLLSLAEIASQPGYVKPEYVEDTCIEVMQGRHPMVEQALIDRGGAYVPNDIKMSSDETRALLVTGPNMGGKSSYVRQVALIAIMGQIGSYVPADSAKLGMLDAVFTRMGAFDNMMSGESTFQVELSETADVLKKATPRSLVILDELGRGTSTHDGVAIANAVLDYIVREAKCLTLFITHYQNLSSMASSFPGHELKNVHMKFQEEGEDGQDITFLYEVGDGVAHRSYGLNVAKLAQLPQAVLDVATVKSAEMERSSLEKKLYHLSHSLSQVLQIGSGGGLEQFVRGVEELA